MSLEEETIRSDVVYNGKLIRVREDLVTAACGPAAREIVEHAEGVVIAALKPDGSLIMERQYRKAAEREFFECPAGKIDPGEDPVHAALRELREETGCRAGRIELLARSWPSAGYSTEVLHIFLCTDLIQGDRDLDDSESIDLEEHPLEELYEMIIGGKLEDGKSQLAILLTRDRIVRGMLEDYLIG